MGEEYFDLLALRQSPIEMDVLGTGGAAPPILYHTRHLSYWA
jgi:hypothetical protein